MCADSREKSQDSLQRHRPFLPGLTFSNFPLCAIDFDSLLRLGQVSIREVDITRCGFQVRMPHESHERKRIGAALDSSCPICVSQVINLKPTFYLVEGRIVSRMQLTHRPRPIVAGTNTKRENVFTFGLCHSRGK